MYAIRSYYVPESELAEHDVDVDLIVRSGLRGVCRMIFQHGFVHADLHPGHLRFLPPGRIVALDVGLVIDGSAQFHLLRQFGMITLGLALAAGAVAFIVGALFVRRSCRLLRGRR